MSIAKKEFLITFDLERITMIEMYCKALGMSRNDFFNSIGNAWYINNIEEMKKVIKAATKNK